jgi:hypothetical protein
MRPPTKLHADEKSGSKAQMLRVVRDLEVMIECGKVQALSVVVIDDEGLMNHDQSYSTEPGSIGWLALAGAHGMAAHFLQGEPRDGWDALEEDNE